MGWCNCSPTSFIYDSPATLTQCVWPGVMEDDCCCTAGGDEEGICCQFFNIFTSVFACCFFSREWAIADNDCCMFALLRRCDCGTYIDITCTLSMQSSPSTSCMHVTHINTTLSRSLQCTILALHCWIIASEQSATVFEMAAVSLCKDPTSYRILISILWIYCQRQLTIRLSQSVEEQRSDGTFHCRLLEGWSRVHWDPVSLNQAAQAGAHRGWNSEELIRKTELMTEDCSQLWISFLIMMWKIWSNH